MTSRDSASGYLHGFSTDEQNRLFEQARFLEPSVYGQLDLSDRRNLIEVGCGVGAQTDILLRRFPDLHITGIDASETQLQRAREKHSGALQSGRLEFTQANAASLPYPNGSFDSGFVCWLLEHVSDPVAVLQELHRVLEPGALLVCTEVMNATFFVHPYSPNTLKYWFAFNDYQWELGGDPFVGAKLGNFLLSAGFSDIQTYPRAFHFDSRRPQQRSRFIDYWIKLLLSGSEGLLASGKIGTETLEGMRVELELLRNDPDAVFFYTYLQATAIRGSSND
jgi:SAM-dependent methyltransferase